MRETSAIATWRDLRFGKIRIGMLRKEFSASNEKSYGHAIGTGDGQSATQRADRVRLAQCGATLLECGLVVITKHIFERHR